MCKFSLFLIFATCIFLELWLCIMANGGPRACSGSRNEIYLNPGPNCERTCRDLNEECLKVYVRPPSGCYCREGFARDDAGRCIPTRLCRPKK